MNTIKIPSSNLIQRPSSRDIKSFGQVGKRLVAPKHFLLTRKARNLLRLFINNNQFFTPRESGYCPFDRISNHKQVITIFNLLDATNMRPNNFTVAVLHDIRPINSFLKGRAPTFADMNVMKFFQEKLFSYLQN